MILFNFKEFLENTNDKLNNLISRYNSEPAFWVIIAIVIFLIGYFAIRYFGRK